MEQLRPLRDEIIMTRCDSPVDPHEGGGGLIKVRRDKNAEVAWFEVVAVGLQTLEISVGDKVLVPMGQYTPPLTLEDGKQYVATSEKDVLVVWDH